MNTVRQSFARVQPDGAVSFPEWVWSLYPAPTAADLAGPEAPAGGSSRPVPPSGVAAKSEGGSR